jgi:predicted nucleic acid-binding protein
VTLRVVLDSMVWVRAAGAGRTGRRGPAAVIVALALDQQFVVVASSYIRAEVLGVLTEEPYYQRKLAPTFDPEAWLDESLAACAELVDVTGPPVLQEHAKDDPILWLAAAGGASHLVTWEQRLLGLKHYRFTQVVTPPAFLRAWRDPAAHEPLPEWKVLRGPGRLPRRRARAARTAAAGT